MCCEEVFNWMELLRNRSGLDIMPVYKKWSTKTPSIQGIWHPFYSEDGTDRPLLTPEEIVKNLHILSRPDTEKSHTAEEILMEVAHKQKLRLDG
ncbi:39S ribosomal protein L43 mitochondrial [Paragonimus kellicotti]|nr:39S ribosomal protein L43 mitochondrial [Paragonimus kellicotti]